MLDFFCYTGLRCGDAARVGRQHVSNGVISLSTEKSQGRTVVHLLMLDMIKRTLEAGPTGDVAFIMTENGRPCAKESLGNAFKDTWSLPASKTSRPAEGGRDPRCSERRDAHELMATFGWVDIKEAEIWPIADVEGRSFFLAKA